MHLGVPRRRRAELPRTPRAVRHFNRVIRSKSLTVLLVLRHRGKTPSLLAPLPRLEQTRAKSFSQSCASNSGCPLYRVILSCWPPVTLGSWGTIESRSNLKENGPQNTCLPLTSKETGPRTHASLLSAPAAPRVPLRGKCVRHAKPRGRRSPRRTP